MTPDILAVPDEILDKILSYLSYDEVSHLRLVCKKFDASSQRILNQGFHRAEKFHSQCFRKVKEQLPRRESERRKHPLSVHCDILTAIDNRLSLLGMTFMKYVELKYCCFIPGKVLDEIFRVLRFVSNLSALPRAHVILQELRDISSMAMDHFDEHIAPAFRSHSKASTKVTVTSYGLIGEPSRYYGSSPSDNIPGDLNYSCELVKLQAAVRLNSSKILEMKKENVEMKRKIAFGRKRLNEQQRRISDLENAVSEQNLRITNQENKTAEINRKFDSYEKSVAEVNNLLLHLKAEEKSGHPSGVNMPSEDIAGGSETPVSPLFSKASSSRIPVKRKRKMSCGLYKQASRERCRCSAKRQARPCLKKN